MESESPLLGFIESLQKFLTENKKTSIVDRSGDQWYMVTRKPNIKNHRNIFNVKDILPKD